jgi:tetratricopeptide (TPR) repeat protein
LRQPEKNLICPRYRRFTDKNRWGSIFMTARPLRLFSVLALFAIMSPPALAGWEDSSLSGNYLAGRFAGKEKDIPAAAKFFGRALNDDPSNPVLIERAFVLHVSAGEMADAEEFATRVLSFNSQHRMARIVLGLRDMRFKRHAAARQHFAKAAYTPIGELTSGLLTAWSYAAERKGGEAMTALDKLDSNDSFANFKLFHAAMVADYTGQHLRAEGFYKKAYEQTGSSLRVVQAYGSFLERTGRAAEARKVYGKFLEASPDNPVIAKTLAALDAKKKPRPFIATALMGASEALFSLSSSMADDQGAEVALIYARLALSLEGGSAVAQTLLGDIYENMERYDEAIQAYEKIGRNSELRSNGEIEIAINAQRLKRPAEAKSRLQQLIAREPRNYDAIITYGNILRANEEFAEAAKAYGQALALVPKPGKEHWSAFYYRGICHERTKQWPLAEADFRKALELEPEQALVLNYLGYSLIDQRLKLDEALAMVKKAVELKPNDGYIVDSLGWAYYQLGDFEEAVKHLERAVELKPADPTINDHLGDAYWRVGRRLEAKFQWQHAKDNKPEAAALKTIEDKLANGLKTEPPVKPAQNTATGDNG